MEDFVPALLGLIVILLTQVVRLRKALLHQDQQQQNQQQQYQEQVDKLSAELSQLKTKLSDCHTQSSRLQKRCDQLEPANNMLTDAEFNRDKTHQANQRLEEEKYTLLQEFSTQKDRIHLLEQHIKVQAEQVALLKKARQDNTIKGEPSVFSDYDSSTQKCGLPNP
jgi:predicted nuclease with TOPRIM domain